jgi:hypothetical protein
MHWIIRIGTDTIVTGWRYEANGKESIITATEDNDYILPWKFYKYTEACDIAEKIQGRVVTVRETKPSL